MGSFTDEKWRNLGDHEAVKRSRHASRAKSKQEISGTIAGITKIWKCF